MKVKITWEQELDDVRNPYETVQECIRDIIDGETLQFTVEDTETGKKYSVDASEDEEDAIVEIL